MSATTLKEYSPDFMTALRIYKETCRSEPPHDGLRLHNNVTEAAVYRKKASGFYIEEEDDDVTDTDDTDDDDTYVDDTDEDDGDADDIKSWYKHKSKTILKQEAFEYWTCRTRAYSDPYRVMDAIHAKSILNDIFIPIHFDFKRGFLHTSRNSRINREAIKGTSFSELGVCPVFLCRKYGGFKLVVPE